MAGLSQNLKAVITFGGSIDSSWSRSANSLQKSLKDVGKQSEKLTKSRLSWRLRLSVRSWQGTALAILNGVTATCPVKFAKRRPNSRS